MAQAPPLYLTRAERQARGRIAISHRNRRTPKAEDLQLLEAARAERPIRRLAWLLATLPPERRRRVAELAAEFDQEGAAESA